MPSQFTNTGQANDGTRGRSSDLSGAEVRFRKGTREAAPDILAVGRAAGTEKAAFSDVPRDAPATGETRPSSGHKVDGRGLSGDPLEKWTQGEWFADGSYVCARVSDGARTVTVADVLCNSEAETWPERDAETKANARIMAAAPEMYEALRFSQEVIAWLIERFHSDCRCQVCESLPMAIDAARAKATGGAL